MTPITKLASTKPYLIRAIYEWCIDQGFTPYLTVTVDGRTRVPREYVKDGQIVLNLDQEATHQLQMGNDLITFSARFSGVAQALSIPVVAAIYARENGQGMAFEVVPLPPGAEVPLESAPPADEEPPPAGGRSHLTRIK